MYSFPSGWAIGILSTDFLFCFLGDGDAKCGCNGRPLTIGVAAGEEVEEEEDVVTPLVMEKGSKQTKMDSGGESETEH